MKNYKFIVNPRTGRKVRIDGRIGRQVLNQYLKQNGGVNYYDQEIRFCRYLKQNTTRAIAVINLPPDATPEDTMTLMYHNRPSVIEGDYIYSHPTVAKNDEIIRLPGNKIRIDLLQFNVDYRLIIARLGRLVSDLRFKLSENPAEDLDTESNSLIEYI